MRPKQIDLISERNLLSAKRATNERNGIHAWLPYYAGYSEGFVASALDYLEIAEGKILLDPWNGSGTTGIVCERSNVPSIGVDVNPAMTIFAAAKSGTVLRHEKAIESFLVSLKRLRPTKSIQEDDALLDVLSPSLCAAVRQLKRAIDAAELPCPRLCNGLRLAFRGPQRVAQPVRSFLVASLFVTTRLLAKYKGRSNPTWFGNVDTKVAYDISALVERYQEVSRKMLQDLRYAEIAERSAMLHGSMTGDSRRMSIEDGSVDAIITSPPYLTRIDYAISTQPELLILGDAKSLRTVRANTMGAPVITGDTWDTRPSWGRLCNGILQEVKNHKTKAAKSYYFKNIVQYFSDADLSLQEIIRVLKAGSSALVVVQSSYFKEVEIPLGDIYVEMATLAGGNAKIVRREIVKGHLAHVNSKSSEYIRNKVYYEDVIEVRKPKKY